MGLGWEATETGFNVNISGAWNYGRCFSCNALKGGAACWLRCLVVLVTAHTPVIQANADSGGVHTLSRWDT